MTGDAVGKSSQQVVAKFCAADLAELVQSVPKEQIDGKRFDKHEFGVSLV